MTVHLRPARPTDAGHVAAILSGYVDETPWLPRQFTRAEELSFAGKMVDLGWVTVAEQDKVCGFVARREAEILALYVAPDARCSGLGRALLAYAKTCAPRLTLWTYQANTAAQRFYLRYGFRETGRTDGPDNDARLPDVHFSWQDEGST